MPPMVCSRTSRGIRFGVGVADARAVTAPARRKQTMVLYASQVVIRMAVLR